MIRLTRLDGHEFIMNCDLIEFFESTPDTVITLVTGKKIIVKESADRVYQMIVTYKQTIHTKPVYRDGHKIRVVPEEGHPFLLEKKLKESSDFTPGNYSEEFEDDDDDDENETFSNN